jgi:hypothetical protein
MEATMMGTGMQVDKVQFKKDLDRIIRTSKEAKQHAQR